MSEKYESGMVRTQVTLDLVTIEHLRRIADRVPDVRTRSAAIRYAARTARELLERPKKERKPCRRL